MEEKIVKKEEIIDYFKLSNSIATGTFRGLITGYIVIIIISIILLFACMLIYDNLLKGYK